MQITERARADGKSIEGLETVIDQLSVFDSCTFEEQTRFLLDSAEEEEVKDLPCAMVLVVTDDAGEPAVTVLPITHQRPSGSKLGVEIPHATVEIPHATKGRLGLDDARSWVVLSEANRFIWPGPELRPAIPGDAGSVAYDLLPYALFEEIRLRFIQAARSRLMRNVKRTE